MMININNRADVHARLEQLKPDSKAVFGIMTAQHMLEHLSYAVMMSNGKRPQKLYFTKEKADRIKAHVIHSDLEMPIGFKAPMLTDELPPLVFPDFDTALNLLKRELSDYDAYLQTNKNALHIHPTMDVLDDNEWIKFHNKHFTHHFKQFNLI